MRTIVLEVGKIESAAAVQRYLQYMLDLPPYYGRNLDALYDALCECAQQTRLILRGAGRSGECAAYWPRLAAVMQDAARENPRIQVEIEA